jgi:hypothetical protein
VVVKTEARLFLLSLRALKTATGMRIVGFKETRQAAGPLLEACALPAGSNARFHDWAVRGDLMAV